MADPGVGDPHQDLAPAGRGHVDLEDLQGLAGGHGDGGA
jgi:hypothetical protein